MIQKHSKVSLRIDLRTIHSPINYNMCIVCNLLPITNKCMLVGSTESENINKCLFSVLKHSENFNFKCSNFNAHTVID